MRKETCRLLSEITDRIITHERKPTGKLSVLLRVCAIEDEDIGVRYSLKNPETGFSVSDGKLKLSWSDNPLFGKRQGRHAEQIAMEAYNYFISNERKCEIHHYPPRLLI